MYMYMCVCVDKSTFTLVCAAVSHHGNVLSRLLEFSFHAASDVSEVRQRELFELRGPQDAGVGLKHLQSLDDTQQLIFLPLGNDTTSCKNNINILSP